MKRRLQILWQRPEHPASSWMMWQLLLACLPAFLLLISLWGIGILYNLLLAAFTALLVEGLVLRWRQQSLGQLRDASALVTGLLLGACLPAGAPAWLVISGVAFGLLAGKQLFGGLGHNLLNPAMTGYVFLLLCFPQAMSDWPLPVTAVDGLSSATPLGAWHNKGLLMAEELWSDPARIQPASLQAWQLLNLGWLLGGFWLVCQRIIDWRIPCIFLGSLLVFGALIWGMDTSHHLSPWHHLSLGATCMAAFFILTEPVTGARSTGGKKIMALLAGLLVVLLREAGHYPGGVALALLLVNLVTPLLDRWLPSSGIQDTCDPTPTGSWLRQQISRPPLLALPLVIFSISLYLLLADLPHRLTTDPQASLHQLIEAPYDQITSANLPDSAWLVWHQGKLQQLIMQVTARGYRGDIELLLAITPQGRITGIHLLQHQETASLGGLIDLQHSDWLQQFIGRSLQLPDARQWLHTSGYWDSLSGATRTTDAVIQAVGRALEQADDWLRQASSFNAAACTGDSGCP